jgi:hypothetical protein
MYGQSMTVEESGFRRASSVNPSDMAFSGERWQDAPVWNDVEAQNHSIRALI